MWKNRMRWTNRSSPVPHVGCALYYALWCLNTMVTFETFQICLKFCWNLLEPSGVYPNLC